MISGKKLSITQFKSQYPLSFYGLIGVIFLFISGFFFNFREGIYMTLIIATIIVEVLIGSIFLLYNTASLMLAKFFPDTLTEPEKAWIRIQMRKNIVIIFIWITTIIGTFLIIGSFFGLGVVSSLYLLSLIILYHYAGTDENPFLEQRYELT
ncbi:MAG: hypothetical protein EAX86_04395 [Candidatus Heimdallarchaeota archaeon]|nr:hypothetical protein [Candidatus Heimdallarchaeota archaeon]